MKEKVLAILLEVFKRTKSIESAQNELFTLFYGNNNDSDLNKAEMINALTNTMKVNKEIFGGYKELKEIAYTKLIATIESIDI